MPSLPIDEVLKAHTAALMAMPGVVGTGIGEDAGKPCILVLVRQRDAGLERRIPKDLDGYPVKVDAVGDVHAPPRF